MSLDSLGQWKLWLPGLTTSPLTVHPPEAAGQAGAGNVGVKLLSATPDVLIPFQTLAKLLKSGCIEIGAPL